MTLRAVSRDVSSGGLPLSGERGLLVSDEEMGVQGSGAGFVVEAGS